MGVWDIIKGDSVRTVCFNLLETAFVPQIQCLRKDYEKLSRNLLDDPPLPDLEMELLNNFTSDIEFVPELDLFRYAPTCYMTGVSTIDLRFQNAFPLPGGEALKVIARPMSLDHLFQLDARRSDDGDKIVFVRHVTGNIGCTTWVWNRAKSVWPPVIVYLLAVLCTKTMSAAVATRICDVIVTFWNAWEIGHEPNAGGGRISVQQWYRSMRLHDQFMAALDVKFATPIPEVWERLRFGWEVECSEWMNVHYPLSVNPGAARTPITAGKPYFGPEIIRTFQELTRDFLLYCNTHYGGIQYHLSVDRVISFTGDDRPQALLQLEAMSELGDREGKTHALILIFNALHHHAYTTWPRLQKPTTIWMSDVDCPNLFFRFGDRTRSPLILSRSRRDHRRIPGAEDDSEGSLNYTFGYPLQVTYSFEDIIYKWNIDLCNVKGNTLFTNYALGPGSEIEALLSLDRYRLQANHLLHESLPWFLEEEPEPGRQYVLDVAMLAAAQGL